MRTRSSTRSRNAVGLLLAEDEVADRLVEARQRPQLLDPVGIGQEPAVEDEVDVEGHAVLVPEGHDRGPHGRLPASSPKSSISAGRSWLTLSSPVSTTTSARSRSRLEQAPLVGDGLGPPWPPGWGGVGGSPRSAGPARRRGRRGRGAAPGSGPREGVDRGEGLVEVPSAPAEHEGHPLHLRPGPSTTSATLAMRADGMLSITYHPRSSRVAAAVERPAPDMPVTTR